MKLHVGASCLMLVFGLSFVEAQNVRREDVPKYLKQLQSSTNAKDRATAAAMLGKRGSVNVKDVEDAIEPLKKTVQKDVDANVRKAAANALGSIGAKPDELVPALVECLKKEKDKDVKKALVESLGRYGAEAKSAIPAIREFAKDFDQKSPEAVLARNAVMAISGSKKK